MRKKYKLLKDIVDAKDGTLFYYNEANPRSNRFMNYGNDVLGSIPQLCQALGINNKEWFEEMQETPVKAKEEDFKVGELYQYYGEDGTEGVILEVIKKKGKLYFKDIETSIDDGYYSEPCLVTDYFTYNYRKINQ